MTILLSRPSLFPNRRASENQVDFDSVLTGTTLRVYRYLVTLGRPAGPRELQKSLKLSSPTVASFHLEKLERNGLATKSGDGTYTINHVYLKHFILLRKHLIPRYFFFAALSTTVVIGWGSVLYLGGVLDPATTTFTRQTILYLLMYGILTSGLLAGILWHETIGAIKNEKI